MPKLAAISFVLTLAQVILAELLGPDESEGLLVWRQLLLVMLPIPFCLAQAPPCIAFYRCLLLGEVTQRYALDISSPRVRAYFGWSAALTLFFGLVTTAGFYFNATVGAFSGYAVCLIILVFPQCYLPQSL